MDWCGEFQPMNPTPPPPPPPVVHLKMPEPVATTSVSVMQQLDEGVPQMVLFQKARSNGTLKEIQESPLFGE